MKVTRDGDKNSGRIQKLKSLLIAALSAAKEGSAAKKRITEAEAAAQCVLVVMQKTEEIWPALYKSLKDVYGDKLVIENETIATFDLSLAVLALELRVLHNASSKEQAARIRKWVLHCVDSPKYGEYARDEVEKYERAFLLASENCPVTGENPVDAVSARLLHRWLGKAIGNFEVRIADKGTGVINPLLVLHVTAILVSSGGSWKQIRERFDLIEGDVTPGCVDLLEN